MEFEFTGERLVTSVYNDSAIEHLHRYAYAIPYVKEKVVLDIACGEGYGSNILSKYSKNVIGVDISVQVIDHAKKKYVNNNLIFKVGDVTDIPLENNIVDVVVSFETLEHIKDHEGMFREIKRVLKPNGIIIISTPEKKNYSDNSEYINEFHEKELYLNEFKSLIEKFFNFSKFLFQNKIHGSLIIPETLIAKEINFSEGDFDSLKKSNNFKSQFNLAIASDVIIENPILDIFIDDYFLNLKMSEYIENKIKKILISKRYRLGDWLISPFSFFLKFFK